MAAKANGSTSAESAPASKAHALAESAYLAKVMELVPIIKKTHTGMQSKGWRAHTADS